MMKKWLVLLATLVLWASPVSAGDLQLIWNPNVETDLAGYRLYTGDAPGGPYTQIGEAPVSPSPSFVFSVPANIEKTFYFVATAYDTAGNESGYSNEVSKYVDTIPPGAPTGLTIVIVNP